MHANVKPLTHWLIYHGYSVRFRKRSPHSVQGVMTTPEGEIPFDYDPVAMIIRLPDKVVTINRYGWETDDPVSQKAGKENDPA